MAIAAMGVMMGMQMLPQIASLIRGDGNPYKEVKKTMKRGGEFAAAAADPTSAMYKAAQAEAAGPLRQQAIAGIENMYKIARRAKARGDMSSLVNPERRDEGRSRAIMAAFEQAQVLGGQQAQSRLSGAAQTLYGSAQGQMGLAEGQMAMDEAKQAKIQNLFSMGGGLLGSSINQFMPNLDSDIMAKFSRQFQGSSSEWANRGVTSVGGK